MITRRQVPKPIVKVGSLLPEKLKEHGVTTREIRPWSPYTHAGRVLMLHVVEASEETRGLVLTIAQQPEGLWNTTGKSRFVPHKIVSHVQETILAKDRNSELKEFYINMPGPISPEQLEIIRAHRSEIEDRTPEEAQALLLFAKTEPQPSN